MDGSLSQSSQNYNTSKNNSTEFPEENRRFSILDHLHKLSPTKTKGKYICPICQGNNLGIRKDGAYQCFSGGCDLRHIREAIAPWEDRVKKAPRPKTTRMWEYPSRQGSPLVRVVRMDDGNGKKKIWQERWDGKEWLKNLEGIKKQDIPIYRYQEVREAVAAGKKIFIVEGEPCADLLWKMGIPATTNIGGSGKWKVSDSADLKGAEAVLCPDRDEPGLKHMVDVSKQFPSAQWLLAFPDSPLWSRLPKEGGVDIADWIEDFRLTAEDIEKGVTSKEEFEKKTSEPNSSEILQKGEDTPRQAENKVPSRTVEERLDELIEKRLTGSALTIELKRIACEYQWYLPSIEKVYHQRKSEKYETDERAEAKKNLPQLLANNKLDLRDYLWGDNGKLAEAMIATAKAMPTSPEFLFTTLLPVCGALIGTSSRIIIKAKAKYKQPCIFWTAIVARSGKIKTPSQRIILEPLYELEKKANDRYNAELATYETDLAVWKKDKDADLSVKPKAPIRQRYVTKDSTMETLEKLHGENPKGLLVHRDEIAEDFKADNAYRGGKGADTEKKIDQWNGSPITTDRMTRSVFLEKSAISRTGSIQWEVLQSLMGDHRDASGNFARWLFCAAESPNRFINFTEDEANNEIDELLSSLYLDLGMMREQDYLLSPEAKEIFQEWQHKLVRWEIEENHPALKLTYPKIEAYTARFALVLHLVNAALERVDALASVGGHTMAMAVRLAEYFLSQTKLVMATNSEQAGLTGDLLRIQKYCEGKSGGTRMYELKRNVNSLKKSPTEVLLSHCKWLSENGYGTLKDTTYFVGDVGDLLVGSPTTSNADSSVIPEEINKTLLVIVGDPTNTPKPNDSNASGVFVGDVGDFCDLENSKQGHLEKITEPHQHHQHHQQNAETHTQQSLECVGSVTNNHQQPPTTTNKYQGSPEVENPLVDNQSVQSSLPIYQQSDGGFGVLESAIAPAPITTPAPTPAHQPESPALDIKVGDRLRFTNPFKIPSLRALEKLELIAKKDWRPLGMDILDCDLPNGEIEGFSPADLTFWEERF